MPGSIIISERDFPARNFAHTEFYNEWLIPQKNVEAASAIMLEASATDIIVLTMHYPLNDAEMFDRLTSEVFLRVRGQLKRSVDMARTFERILGQERSVSALLARSDDIAFVIDEERRLSSASEVAEGCFRALDLISLKSNVVAILVPEIDSWLRQTLYCLASGAPLDSTSRIFRHGRHVYQIVVGLLPRSISSMPISWRRLYLVTIRALSASSDGQSVMQFGSAFGLTPSEIRLCGVLAQNYTLKEAADMLSVTHETARQRLKTIFQKTGTNRQSELVALLKRLL